MPNAKDLLNENIIGLLGIESLPEKDKIALVSKLAELVMKRVMLRAMSQLSDADAKAINEMPNDEEKILTYIGEKVPNFMDIVKEETIKVKAEMAEVASQV
jgi:hypothetical protein